MVTLIPAYGRDYKSQAAALKDFNDGKEFNAISLTRGNGYVTREELVEAGEAEVAIRYNNQKMKFFVRLVAPRKTA
jgi:hypothetical protein